MMTNLVKPNNKDTTIGSLAVFLWYEVCINFIVCPKNFTTDFNHDTCCINATYSP